MIRTATATPAGTKHRLKEIRELSIIAGGGPIRTSAVREATAKAVQRIPDAHCNGDMHAALDYAAEVKHKQRDFVAKRGISAIIN